MKLLMKLFRLKNLCVVVVWAVSTSVLAGPNSDTHGYVYYTQLHEAGLYKGAEFYRKNYTDRERWVDAYLNQVAHARYEAIDWPMVAAAESALVDLAAEEGLSLRMKNVYTQGVLKASFSPGVVNNSLDFTISGISLSGYGSFKKSWYADGYVRFDIKNITVRGSYDYYNGLVSVTSVDAPVSAKVDVDLDIPVIGLVFDPIIDDYIDDMVVESLPSNIGEMFNGGPAYNQTVAGIEDYVPLNKLVYNGVDYGALIRSKLSKNSLINDDFSISIGDIVAHNQRVEISIGNFTYKRWTTGGKRVCKLSPSNPNCLHY